MIFFEVFRRFTKNRIHGIMKETGQIKPEDKENFMNQESQTPHKRRVRCDQQGKHTGWNAYFHYGKRDH